MSHSARLFVTLIFIMMFHSLILFLNTGYASDSLKVGLLLQSIDKNEIDSLSNQLIQTLHEKSKLQIVSIDTNNSIVVEPFVIDSITVKELKQQRFQGLIFCKHSASNNVHRLLAENQSLKSLLSLLSLIQ